ncbi:hypothetical protein ACU4GD_14200 [Cupriavidus basilensis]
MQITNTCDAERYPRAIQNSYGAIMLVFSRYDSAPDRNATCADGVQPNGYPYSDLHQIWSNDDGLTWTGESTLFHTSIGSALRIHILQLKLDIDKHHVSDVVGRSSLCAPENLGKFGVPISFLLSIKEYRGQPRY